MLFNCDIKESGEIKTLYDRAMGELSSWYEFTFKEHAPKVFIVEDKETFFALAGTEKPEYVRGFGDYCNNIFIYSPQAQEKYTIHKYIEEDYYKFLKHELDHRFFYVYTKSLKYPKWLVEGNAGYVAGQMEKLSPVTEFSKFLDMDKKMEGSAYLECGYVVKVLIENFGKDKYLEFLLDLGEKDFKEEFVKNFGIELEYEEFNKLLRS